MPQFNITPLSQSLYSFFLGDSPASEFYLPTFQNTLSVPIFIGHVNKKNNLDDIARLFIQVKVKLKRSLDQLEGGGMGRGMSK